jgi:hypothetical protein
MNKEYLALRNNFSVTKKFLIAKFDFIGFPINMIWSNIKLVKNDLDDLTVLFWTNNKRIPGI